MPPCGIYSVRAVGRGQGAIAFPEICPTPCRFSVLIVTPKNSAGGMAHYSPAIVRGHPVILLCIHAIRESSPLPCAVPKSHPLGKYIKVSTFRSHGAVLLCSMASLSVAMSSILALTCYPMATVSVSNGSSFCRGLSVFLIENARGADCVGAMSSLPLQGSIGSHVSP